MRSVIFGEASHPMVNTGYWPLVTGFWLDKDQYEMITQVTSNQ